LHPAALDALLQAARLAYAAAAGLELMPQRQQLISLSSFAPAAGSSSGSSSSSSGEGTRSQQAVASSCHGPNGASVGLLAVANGHAIAQLSGLAYAAGSQLTGSNASAAASELVDAAGCNHTYQTVWLADCPEAADCSRQPSASSCTALLAAAQHHHISFGSPGAPSRRLQLEAGQPSSVAAMILLAALQQSAASRDKQVGYKHPFNCCMKFHDCTP
jgi:hypothetical protein